MKYFLPLILCLSVPAFAQFSLSFRGVEAPSELKAEVEAALPDSIKTAINSVVRVEFRKLEIKGKKVLGMVPVNPLNRKGSRTIIVNEELLAPQNRDKAVSTVIHEVGHIFDNQNLVLPQEQHLKEERKYSVSDSPIFLNLASFKGKKQTNKKLARSVDVYENKNPQEFFAVNLEHFLQDPDYKCRRPSLYRYYQKNLNHTPFPEAQCELEYKLAPTIDVSGKTERQKSLDPSRLYEVHYLFAGRGTNVMSKWGHAMLRLVMCSPSRKEVSEKCLQDRAHHVVVSFRADITNFNISYLKGLTGKYPSRMFILSMADVIKEYTVGELRDLWSIPLKMSQKQKENLLLQVLEKYWAYEGKYFFITNNCADETLTLLRNAYPDVPGMPETNVTTPLGLKTKLEKMNIADMSVFENREEAKKAGYLFESLKPRLERIMSALKEKNVLSLDEKETEKFLSDSTVEERQRIAEEVSDSDTLGKLLFLEDTILSRKIIDLQKKMSETLDQEDRAGGKGDLILAYRALEDERKLLSGINLSKGYGLPLKTDEIFQAVNVSPEQEARLKELQEKFSVLAREKFKSDQELVLGIMENKQKLLNRMK